MWNSALRNLSVVPPLHRIAATQHLGMSKALSEAIWINYKANITLVMIFIAVMRIELSRHDVL